MIKNSYFHISNDKNIILALLSDIHYAKKYKRKTLEEIYHNLKKHNPNYICVPGDFLDQGDVLEDQNSRDFFLSWLQKIAQIAPVIISLGNHDIGVKKPNWKYYNPVQIIKSISSISNVFLLDNSFIIKDNLCFLGYTPSYHYYNDEPHEQVEPYALDIDLKLGISDVKKYYSILLCHTPIYITNPMVRKTKVIQNIDLVLCGHMHGGIISFPVNTGLISPSKKLFPKHAWGNFLIENTQYIVSKGIIAFSDISPKIFHAFNFLYPSNIEYIYL